MVDWQNLQAQLPLLDEHQLQRMKDELGEQVLGRLLRLFLEDGQQLGDTLQLAFMDNNTEKMASCCHSLRSACGSYGALRCQYLSEKLEQSCHQEDEANIAPQFHAWQQALTATLDEVRTRLEWCDKL
ncbi:histidine kinase [Oceanisphaera marina]|uniref:Histidine kinase n=1 Tax=Oceanisphaera marina TaxID=2017550 RepID=A0ABQ1INR2_9GAMM|nr:Hpt domain-containing protein [Oceanisphaera marina]GGB46134.1 histidine kinase [Oceanisphaera marina]